MYRELLAREVVGGLDNEEREALPIVAEAYSRMVQVLEIVSLLRRNHHRHLLFSMVTWVGLGSTFHFGN